MSRENVEPGYRIPLAGVDVNRPRRTLDERILVRFPALARGISHLVWRLPKRSRLRRALVVRAVANGYCAGNRRDFDVLLLGLDPDIDYRAVSGGPGGVAAPDLVGHHHGHAGYRNVWRALLEGFEDLTLEPQELLDLGDRLIGVIRMRGIIGKRCVDRMGATALDEPPRGSPRAARRFGGHLIRGRKNRWICG